MQAARADTFPQQNWTSGKSLPRQFIEDLGIRILSLGAAGVRSVLGSRAKGAFGILMYHRIAQATKGVPFPTINVEPEKFRAQISGLLKLGYEFWPLSRVLQYSANRQPIPAKVSVITFDDGFEGVYAHAWPVLRELMVPATIFVSTAYIGSEKPFPFDRWGLIYHRRVNSEHYRPLNWDQCREMLNDGLIEIGSHTHTHQDFRGVPELLREDLDLSLRELQDQLGIENPTFAFPYGTPRLGFASREMFDVTRQVGLCCALSTGGQVVSPRDDPFGWGRFNVFPWDSGATIAGRLDGWYSWAPRIWQSMLSVPRRLLGKSEKTATNQVASPAAVAEAHTTTPMAIIPDLPVKEYEPDLISIVVPTYNRCEWLNTAIRSLDKLETDGRFRIELLVVDNASTDETADVVQLCQAELDLPITYLVETKPGDAPPRNLGVRHANGRWLAFFDDDQLADPNWLVELHQATMESGATVVGGAVHLYLTQEESSRLGPICRKALRETRLYKQLQPYTGNDLPGTGNALVERRVFEAVGLFDESMSAGGSDFAFFERARRAGYELWYTPHAIINHRVAPQRMTEEYFRWDALSSGVEQAYRVHSNTSSALWTGVMGVARIGQAVLISLPLLLWGLISRNKGEVLGRRTRLWRVEGYWRKLLNLMAPSFFRQKSFFDSLEFRNSRTIESS